MNNDDFDEVVVGRFDKCQNTLICKAKEYANGEDRLVAFKRAAALNETTASLSLIGMALKHLVSVLDLAHGRLENNSHNRNEKIGDLINYLILLEALLIEEEASKRKEPSNVVARVLNRAHATYSGVHDSGIDPAMVVADMHAMFKNEGFNID